MTRGLSIFPSSKCELTSTGLIFHGKVPFDEWEKVGESLRVMDGAVKFWIGDWLNYGEATYGEKYAQAVEATGYNYQTLRTVAWVSRSIELSRRRDKVPFELHAEVAALRPADQERWLAKCESEQLKRRDLRSAIKRGSVANDRPIKVGKLKLEVLEGNMQTVGQKIADNSADLILTDPPYPKEFLPLWTALSSFSARVLKPGGFCIAYTGQAYLPEMIRRMETCLSYYWLGSLLHKGQAGQRFEVNMFNRAKPILFFYKPPLSKQETWLEDVVVSPSADKDAHVWGQSVEPLITLIEAFTKPGETIVDPFVGGGATLEAASKTQRHCTGIEIDQEAVKLLKKRLG